MSSLKSQYAIIQNGEDPNDYTLVLSVHVGFFVISNLVNPIYHSIPLFVRNQEKIKPSNDTLFFPLLPIDKG